MEKISAQYLAILSLIIWLISLVFVGFTVGDKEFLGTTIFFMGWLGPIDLNFTWYTNIFYFYALFGLLDPEKKRIKSVIYAIVFSLTLFLLNTIMLNEGGGQGYIYGYGIGAILWSISIYILLISSGIRLEELKSLSNNNGDAYRFRYIGIFLVFTIIIVSSSLAISNRANANKSEMKRLANVVFKRGEVCSIDLVPKKIIKLTGILEVINPNNEVFPFTSPKNILDWGVPIVRMNGLDYSYLNNGEEQLLVAKKSTEPIEAILTVKSERNIKEKKKITITLKTNNEKYSEQENLLFYQEWKQEKFRESYCPDYSYFSDAHNQPGKIISEVLSLKTPKIYVDRNPPTIKAKVLDTIPYKKYKRKNIIECNNRTDKFDRYNKHKELRYVAQGFLNNGIYYFTQYPKDSNFYCDDKFVYISSVHSSRAWEKGNDYKILLEKRNKNNFFRDWQYWISVENSNNLFPSVNIVSIKEDNDSIYIDLLDKNEENVATIEAFKDFDKE